MYGIWLPKIIQDQLLSTAHSSPVCSHWIKSIPGDVDDWAQTTSRTATGETKPQPPITKLQKIAPSIISEENL